MRYTLSSTVHMTLQESCSQTPLLHDVRAISVADNSKEGTIVLVSYEEKVSSDVR